VDLDGLGALVDHSLVQRDPTAREPRFRMLETVREYGLELLGERRPEVERAHAAYFADLAESAELVGPEQQRWLAELDEERDNLRVAIERAAASGDAELELRLTGSLGRFWWLRGALAEGLAYLERAIEHGRDAPPQLVAQACRGAAGLAWSRGARARARELAERGIEAARISGDGVVELSCHTVLGLVARDEADYERARSHLEQSAAIATALGREGDVVVAKMNLGSVAFDSGDHDAGVRLWEDVLVYHRTHGNDEGIGFALLNLGVASHRLQRAEEARARFGEAETLFARIGFREHFAHALQGIAAVDAAEGRALSAARLLGRATRLLAETGAAETNFDAALSREAEASARAQLGEEAFEVAFAPTVLDVEFESRPLPDQAGRRL
jgi:non-specific serine/threonine protein kinase